MMILNVYCDEGAFNHKQAKNVINFFLQIFL
jgi:hypothetical protein